MVISYDVFHYNFRTLGSTYLNSKEVSCLPNKKSKGRAVVGSVQPGPDLWIPAGFTFYTPLVGFLFRLPSSITDSSGIAGFTLRGRRRATFHCHLARVKTLPGNFLSLNTTLHVSLARMASRALLNTGQGSGVANTGRQTRSKWMFRLPCLVDCPLSQFRG